MTLRTASGAPDERQFLEVRNWREFLARLTRLGLNSDAGWVEVYALAVARAWARLGDQQLEDARIMNREGRARAVYGRAYYGAYNYSKAVRYFANGTVSLRGDDHQKVAVDLPDDFPGAATWTTDLGELYQHRLRADYDGWSLTGSQFTLATSDAVTKAEEFAVASKGYMQSKFGVVL